MRLLKRLLLLLGPDYDEAQVAAALNAMDERIDTIDRETDRRCVELESRIAEFDLRGKETA